VKLGAPILDAVRKLIELFAQYAPDRETMDELRRMLDDRGSWPKARSLFDRIRQKRLLAQRSGDVRLDAQFAFEEGCAKTLYNFTHPQAAFDADSPYWIIPDAFVVAEHYGIPDAEVVAAIKA
jgi:hypothetical protein